MDKPSPRRRQWPPEDAGKAAWEASKAGRRLQQPVHTMSLGPAQAAGREGDRVMNAARPGASAGFRAGDVARQAAMQALFRQRAVSPQPQEPGDMEEPMDLRGVDREDEADAYFAGALPASNLGWSNARRHFQDPAQDAGRRWGRQF